MFGRKVSRTVDPDGDGPLTSETRSHTYFGHNVWADYTSDGTVTDRFLFYPTIDKPLGRHRSAEGSAFYLTDQLGSITDVIDTDGGLINHIDYDSFGLPIFEQNASDTDRHKYTGREYDNEIGLYDYRTRSYDPVQGRFISPDSIGFESGDANFYRYVANSPLQYTDPYGTTVSVEYANIGKFQKGQFLAFQCLRNALQTSAVDLGVEVITIYAFQSFGPWKPYVGRTSRNTDIRFREHLSSGKKGVGLKLIGEFNIGIPNFPNKKDQERFVRPIEQLVMEAYGGKTQLANDYNAAADKKFKKYKKTFCGT